MNNATTNNSNANNINPTNNHTDDDKNKAVSSNNNINFEHKIENARQEINLDSGMEVDELKFYFEKLRTGVTNSENKKGDEGTNYVSLLNKLKNDLMNNQYYNSNLNLEKKYENVNNSANNTNNNNVKKIKQANVNVNNNKDNNNFHLK